MTDISRLSGRLTRRVVLAVAAIVSALVAEASQANFIINDDDTVTDTTTGLDWDRCTYDGRPFRPSPTSCELWGYEPHTWQEALTFVNTANENNHRGFNDWRLPNKNELESIVKLDNPGLAVDTSVFWGFHDRYGWPQPIATWTSTPREILWDINKTNVWVVDFSDGRVYTKPYSHGSVIELQGRAYVRLVRGGQPSASFDAFPLGGACGSSHNTGTSPLLTAAPINDLCALGNASAVAAGTSTYSWTCAGPRGGSNANCSAPRGYQVTPAITGSGTISPATDQVVAYQATPTFTATPDVGYMVSTWGGSCTGKVSGIGNVNFTVDPRTADCKLRVTFESVTFTPLPILNIDNSGAPTVYEAATDGLLLMRYLMGLRGAELVRNALGNSPQRDATQIDAHIQAYLSRFDVDGDGFVHPHTDGLLIYRRLLGLSGVALTHGAKNGTRSDSQITAAIDALKP